MRLITPSFIAVCFITSLAVNNVGYSHGAFPESENVTEFKVKASEPRRLALQLDKKIIRINDEGSKVNMGEVYKDLGLYEKALEFYQKSVQTKKRLGDTEGEANDLQNTGLICFCLGQYPMAIDYYERSRTIYRKLGKTKDEVEILYNIAEVYQNLGQFVKALDHYEKGLEIQGENQDTVERGNLFFDIGVVYQNLGLYSRAQDFYDQSLIIFRKLGDPKDLGAYLLSVAQNCQEIGKSSQAIKYLNELVTVIMKGGTIPKDTLDTISNCYLDAGAISSADSLIRESGKASTLGRQALIKSDYSNAVILYGRDVKRAEESGVLNDLFTNFTGLAKAHEGLKDYGRAEEFYGKALKITDQMRSRLLPSERKNFLSRKINGFKVSDPVRGLMRVRMRLGNNEDSIASGELFRSTAFGDHLVDNSSRGSTGITSEVLGKQQSLINKLASLENELGKTDEQKQKAKYDILSSEVKTTQRELSSFRESLRKNYPAYAAVRYPKMVTLEQSAIKPEEYVVVLDVFDDGVGVKLVHDKKVNRSSYVEWPIEALEKDVRKLREPLENPRLADFRFDLAASVYTKLFSQILSDVPKGTPLVIIPDNLLAILPFEALVTSGAPNWFKSSLENYPDHLRDCVEGVTFLGDEHPLTYYESITGLTLNRNYGNKARANNNAMVIADPQLSTAESSIQQPGHTRIANEQEKLNVQLIRAIEQSKNGFGLVKPLPNASALAQQLVKIFSGNCLTLIGQKANKPDFMSNMAPSLDRYGNVVFATLAVFSNKIPVVMEPFLVLTMTRPGVDGFLKLTDILSLKMNADVVGLTACQVKSGEDFSGQDLIMMGGAFQFAGAKSVLMSLWEVEEICSNKLITSFFKHRRNGVKKLEALQAAKKDIRNEGYNHPYFWAGFTLVGEAF